MEELEEIKGMTIEEIGKKDQTWLERFGAAIQKRIENIREKNKADERSQTPEGQKLERQIKEFEERQARGNQAMETAYEARLLKAKRQLALDLFADELLAKKSIRNDDPRLNAIMTEIQDIRSIVAAAYTRSSPVLQAAESRARDVVGLPDNDFIAHPRY